ncbi:hypothetical protein GRS80_00535 [Natrialba sp. INN-245]|nr:hypothetical protein [Natrialba sp. INN-245]
MTYARSLLPIIHNRSERSPTAADRPQPGCTETGSYRRRTGRLSRHELGGFLYSDLSVSYPVLAAITALYRCCLDRQRVVRDHLVRRV